MAVAASGLENVVAASTLAASATTPALAAAATATSGAGDDLSQNLSLSKKPASLACSSGFTETLGGGSLANLTASELPSATTSPRTRTNKSFSKSKITRRFSVTLPD